MWILFRKDSYSSGKVECPFLPDSCRRRDASTAVETRLRGAGGGQVRWGPGTTATATVEAHQGPHHSGCVGVNYCVTPSERRQGGTPARAGHVVGGFRAGAHAHLRDAHAHGVAQL